MSVPVRPGQGSQPDARHRSSIRDSPTARGHRRRPSDQEYRNRNSLTPVPAPPAHRQTPDSNHPHQHRHQHQQPIPSPDYQRYNDREPMMAAEASPEIGRKRSLIRPERNRIDRDHPQYQYRKHARNMPVYPSTTGYEPGMGDDVIEAETTASSGSAEQKTQSGIGTVDGTTEGSDGHAHPNEKLAAKAGTASMGRKLQRGLSRKGEHVPSPDLEKVKKGEAAQKGATRTAPVRPPSLWETYCGLVTFWAPNAILKCFGKPAEAQQKAWREKIGLISIILLIAAFVGYLTFGFTDTVCPSGGSPRLRVNKVGSGFMIFHGQAYDLSRSRHPLARGVPDNSNVLFDMDEKHGGQDGSFLFQNVNGACKGLISKTDVGDIPTNDNDDLGWYFPCATFNQDGSSQPNLTVPYYSGHACHTSRKARDTFYKLRRYGDVYFTWDDIRNSSRTLMVWGGDVLDLTLLDWFNKTEISYNSKFDDIRSDPSLRGVDTTLLFSSKADRQIARCLTEITKVGSINTDTVGCIASRVVLYISLAFILSIVMAKFVLALFFQWFMARRFETVVNSKAAGSGSKKGSKQSHRQRQRQIEEWSDDIYRAPPRYGDVAVASPGTPDRAAKRGSFFPTTSRFTSPYAIDRSTAKHSRAPPTTMGSQSSTARLVGSGQLYRQSNLSQTTMPTHADSHGKVSLSESRGSLMLPASSAAEARHSATIIESEGPGPAGFIHDAVVPQPPLEWRPFGYPLAHTICLVTAYSEGADGLRTTLDSIATTEYPNSHKLILLICDGLIKGQGEDLSTPEICLGMMKDHTVLPEAVGAFSYVAVAGGSKRHNMAKVYSGFYDYGELSRVPADRQQRVPMMVVVKCGTADEAKKSKPGNRGKRDSQIILMSFLQKVTFDERMTELEYEMFNGIWKITGLSPDFYEIVLMVDADTKIYPDSLTYMISAMVTDPEIMGLCGETKIANKNDSWITRMQVFEYFVSHHLSKAFESVFGGVTCLPGCFCMYRVKAPKGGQNYWVPILANPDIIEHYSENVIDTLHKKNLLLLGEDRYLSTLMLKTFPKRKQVFVPQAVCKTTVPDQFMVLLSQRRRWINSTVHNLMELVLVRDLCGTFCFSMQFVVFIELVGTLVLPAAIAFTLYLIAISLKAAILHESAPLIPLILLALILGMPGVLIVVTASSAIYGYYMLCYLISLPIWNFVLPTYAYWKFDDFSWGDTRKTAGEAAGPKEGHDATEGEFDSSKITMKRWGDFEQERRARASTVLSAGRDGWTHHSMADSGAGWPPAHPEHSYPDPYS